MRSESTISKWGNSLAVRIPLAIAKQASLGEGDSVTLSLGRDGGIILRPAWLKVVGERGWIVLTKDQRLRYRPLEIAALRASK